MASAVASTRGTKAGSFNGPQWMAISGLQPLAPNGSPVQSRHHRIRAAEMGNSGERGSDPTDTSHRIAVEDAIHQREAAMVDDSETQRWKLVNATDADRHAETHGMSVLQQQRPFRVPRQALKPVVSHPPMVAHLAVGEQQGGHNVSRARIVRSEFESMARCGAAPSSWRSTRKPRRHSSCPP